MCLVYNTWKYAFIGLATMLGLERLPPRPHSSATKRSRLRDSSSLMSLCDFHSSLGVSAVASSNVPKRQTFNVKYQVSYTLTILSQMSQGLNGSQQNRTDKAKQQQQKKGAEEALLIDCFCYPALLHLRTPPVLTAKNEPPSLLPSTKL